MNAGEPLRWIRIGSSGTKRCRSTTARLPIIRIVFDEVGLVVSLRDSAKNRIQGVFVFLALERKEKT